MSTRYSEEHRRRPLDALKHIKPHHSFHTDGYATHKPIETTEDCLTEAEILVHSPMARNLMPEAANHLVVIGNKAHEAGNVDSAVRAYRTANLFSTKLNEYVQGSLREGWNAYRAMYEKAFSGQESMEELSDGYLSAMEERMENIRNVPTHHRDFLNDYMSRLATNLVGFGGAALKKGDVGSAVRAYSLSGWLKTDHVQRKLLYHAIQGPVQENAVISALATYGPSK